MRPRGARGGTNAHCAGHLSRACTGAGFPVSFSIPVFPTIRAEITFRECRCISAPRQMFEVPQHFKIGAFADRSIFVQL